MHPLAVILGGVATIALIGGGIWLFSPSDDDTKLYKDVAACSQDHPADECQKAFDAAKAQEDKAPKFSSSQSCEQVYGPGQCVPRGSDGGFSPFMTGFLLGHILSSPQPAYIDRESRVYSGGGYVGSYSGRSYSPSTTPSAPRSAVPPAVSARGGFGSTAGHAAESAGG